MPLDFRLNWTWLLIYTVHQFPQSCHMGLSEAVVSMLSGYKWSDLISPYFVNLCPGFFFSPDLSFLFNLSGLVEVVVLAERELPLTWWLRMTSEPWGTLRRSTTPPLRRCLWMWLILSKGIHTTFVHPPTLLILEVKPCFLYGLNHDFTLYILREGGMLPLLLTIKIV